MDLFLKILVSVSSEVLIFQTMILLTGDTERLNLGLRESHFGLFLHVYNLTGITDPDCNQKVGLLLCN